MKKLLTILFAVALGLNLSAQVPDYVPTEGLVAWYPLNGDVLDIGPTGMNGVNYGAQCDENRNQIPCEAMSFTAGDYLSVPADSSFTSQEGTMTGWVKLNSYAQSGASGYNHFFNRWEVNSHEFVFAANIYGLYIYVENELFQSDTLPNLNEWHHLAFSYSSISGMAKIYIDGQNIAEFEGVDTVTPTNHPLHIGGNPFVPAYNSVDGSMDDVGIWERTLELSEISALYNAQLPVPGCTDSIACNFNEEATSDDGSCIPSGCMEAEACNYNALAECEGEACDYTCCPGPGCCSAGMYWDYDLEQCLNYETCQEDLDGDGVIGINDLMELLSSFGTMCEEPETGEFTCGDPMNYHGYDYATVQIGDQCWFAENLRTELYRMEMRSRCQFRMKSGQCWKTQAMAEWRILMNLLALLMSLALFTIGTLSLITVSFVRKDGISPPILNGGKWRLSQAWNSLNRSFGRTIMVMLEMLLNLLSGTAQPGTDKTSLAFLHCQLATVPMGGMILLVHLDTGGRHRHWPTSIGVLKKIMVSFASLLNLGHIGFITLKHREAT